MSNKTLALNKSIIYFAKNTGISKITEVLMLKDIFPETTYVCALIY